MTTAIYRWKCAFLRLLYARILFCAGQMWAFESPEENRTASLVVYRVDADDRHGEIVAVVPLGVWVPTLTNMQGEHALFLMTRSALRRSVTKLLSRTAPLPDVEGEYRYFLEEYRSGRTGLFDKPLQWSLGFYRKQEEIKHEHAQIGPKTRILCDRLRETADLLRRVGEQRWCEWLEESFRRIENSDLSGVDHLRGAFGGMGSFNDVLISPVNGHSVSDEESWGLNARLDELRHELYELADYIRRNAEITG